MTIHNAVENGKIDIVRQLLHENPHLVNLKDSDNDAPLHIAAWQRKTKIAGLLLSYEADVNAHGDSGRTPLHYAVESDSKPLIKLLIDKGADSRLTSDAGITPLYSAASSGSRDIVDLFLKLGQPIDVASSIYIDGPNAVLEKIQSDADFINSTTYVDNLIWDAIRVQSVGLTKYLLQHGVKLNQKINGTYPLMDAIAHKNEALVKLLLENRADVSIKDHAGRGILRFCEIYSVPSNIIELLKKHGVS